MSPHFSAPPLSLVLHLWPALQLSPSPPPPHSVCFLWLHRKKAANVHKWTARARGVGAHLGCDLFGWGQRKILPSKISCFASDCVLGRGAQIKDSFFFSPSEALRKFFVITLECFLAKWSNDAFTISAQKVGLNSLTLHAALYMSCALFFHDLAMQLDCWEV